MLKDIRLGAGGSAAGPEKALEAADIQGFAEVLRAELAAIADAREWCQDKEGKGRPVPSGVDAGPEGSRVDGSLSSTTPSPAPPPGAPARGDTLCPAETPYQEAADAQLAGLTFSGGGIRSATFSLGVVQALAELRLLRCFDYLSTVSGGGYLGAWLSALIHRQHGGDVRDFERAMAPEPASVGPINTGPGQAALAQREAPGPELPAVTWLRRYSNYLTPKMGLSGDSMAAAGTFLRNGLINLVPLVLALLVLLLLPWLAVRGAHAVHAATDPGAVPSAMTWALVAWVLALVLLLFAGWYIVQNLLEPAWRERGEAPRFASQGAVLRKIALPLLFGATALSLGTWWGAGVASPGWHPGAWRPYALFLAGAALYALPWLYGAWRAWRGRRVSGVVVNWPRQALALLSAAAAAGGLLLVAVHLGELRFAFPEGGLRQPLPPDTPIHPWRPGAVELLTLGPPLLMVFFTLPVLAHIALAGREFSNDQREWWARMGGWAVFAGLAWGLWFGIALLGPALVTGWYGWAKGLGLIAWVGTTVSGLVLGRGAATSGPGAGRWREWLVRLAPPVFLLGLLVLLAWGLQASLAPGAADGAPALPRKPDFHMRIEAATWGIEQAAAHRLWLALGIGLMAWALLARWVDVNLFSLHHFYHNRLTRCYLGASRTRETYPAPPCDPGTPRNAHPFTGFDAEDDLPVACLHRSRAGRTVYQRPLPIINTALNLVAGGELAWQTRKAAAFAVTPLYSGYELPRSYCLTEGVSRRSQSPNHLSGQSSSQPPGQSLGSARPAGASRPCGGYLPTERFTHANGGFRLGSAMSVSGAAANPNMGYHSSPAVTFLLTLFNVRLGRWCPNPRFPHVWGEPSPKPGFIYQLAELLGFTSAEREWVQLSDGGHFENLGAYELIRRRCRYVVVVDVTADADCHFGDLGNLIRKCYTDFGVEIEIDVSRLRLAGEPRRPQWPCAVGVIRYDRAPTPTACGYLLYLKPGLLGDEPTDVQNYAAGDATFPHQSTIDQFFDEPQFEAYRKLGYHLARRVFTDAREQATAGRGRGAACPLEELFVALRQTWHAPARGADGAQARHAARLDALYERLRADEDLHYLDAHFFPEWPAIMAAPAGTGSVGEAGGRSGAPAGSGNRGVTSPARISTQGEDPPAPPSLAAADAKTTVPAPPTPVAADAATWLPASEAERRAGFYFCNELAAFMETVYSELCLESDYDHPDHRGWMNLFRHWAWCGTFRVTWAVCSANYGARFQTFCQRRLGLGPVELEVEWAESDQENWAPAYAALNHVERGRVAGILPCSREGGHQLARLFGVVSDPKSPDHRLCFPVGFALLRGDWLLYVRIQNHLRNQGLGRAALKALLQIRPRLCVSPAKESPAIKAGLCTAEQERHLAALLRSARGHG